MELISFETRNGIVWVNTSDISLIEPPHLLHFLTFRGYGSFITLRCGKTIHVKPEAAEVHRIIYDRYRIKVEV